MATLPAQTIFSEDFEGGVLPAGWTVFDGDGQTPSGSVSYFTSAWVIRPDPATMGDTVAMSTSWYFPLSGPSDDWLITPQINVPGNVELRWEGKAVDVSFPESYEVRVSTAANPLPVATYTTVLASVLPEFGGARTQHSAALTSLTGNLYFAWRNISFDEYILLIDNVELRNLLPLDAAITNGYRSEFTMVPSYQASSLPVKGEISNVGSDTASNVTLTVNIYNGAFTQVYTGTSAAQNLLPGAASDFNLPPFTPLGPDFYTFELISNLSGDQDGSDDTLYWSMSVTDTTMARDDGQRADYLGIGAGNGGILGQTFVLNAADFVSSVSCYMEVTAGQPYYAEIYDFNGAPTNVLARTDTFVSSVDTAMMVVLPVSGGAIYLPLDTFYIGLPEPDTALEVGVSHQVFTPGATWLDWPSNPFSGWSHNEDFGFNRIYMLRANMEKPCPAYVLNATIQNAACNASDGVAQVGITGGSGPFSYLWSANAGSQTTAMASNLAAGAYWVTITDTFGCSESLQVIVNNLGSLQLTNIAVTDVSCAGLADGSSTASSSGGNPPYSYTWSSGGVGATVGGLAAGNHSVTVTDQDGCQNIQTFQVTQPTTILPNVSFTPATCATCPTGTASANPSGGIPPYSYQWSSGATTPAASGLAPGNYSVTVTDSNGCTGLAIFTVGFVVGLAEEIGLNVEIFPNPSDGDFRIRVQSSALEDLRIEVFTELGQVVWRHTERSVQEYERRFLSSELAAGNYLVRISSGENSVVKRIRIN